MFRSIFTAWRPAVLAAALLALAASAPYVQAAGHGGGGGFHGGGGGFHGGGFHSGGFGGGGFHGGGFHGSYHPGYFGGYHNGYGYGHRGYYGGYYGGYWPGLYGSPAYLSGGYDVAPYSTYYNTTPGYYGSGDYSTTAPDYGLSNYYTPSFSAPALAATAPTTVANATDDRAAVAVHVPADAQVWFDDSPTKQTGDERRYVTPPLTPGKDYSYQVRARWTDSGQAKDETRTITVHANGVTSVDFTQPAATASASK